MISLRIGPPSFPPRQALAVLLLPLLAGCGDGPTEPRPGSLRFETVAAGGATCAITTEGETLCWGYSASGQTGRSKGLQTCTSGASSYECSSHPALVIATERFHRLSLGLMETCAQTKSGGGWRCWGRGDPKPRWNTFGLPSFPLELSLGLRFECAITGPEGAAWCWGISYSGQSGPTRIGEGLSFATISGSHWHACGLTGAGEAYCWGHNFGGGLGIGENEWRRAYEPERVDTDVRFTSLGAGSEFSCALSEAGTVYCWGSNQWGRVGAGDSSLPGDGLCDHWGMTSPYYTEGPVPCSTRPIEVAGGRSYAQLSVSATHTCAIDHVGDAYCWGVNEKGQIGAGPPEEIGESIHVPTLVARGFTWREIHTGTHKTCGIRTDGGLYCWGTNGAGDLGTGDFRNRSTPTRVLGSI
jgi:hypothetical protein